MKSCSDVCHDASDYSYMLSQPVHVQIQQEVRGPLATTQLLGVGGRCFYGCHCRQSDDVINQTLEEEL